jgi:hypothetical protein
MIRGDSVDYKLLEKWAKDFDCQGYKSCEIGVREGLGSKIIMDNIKNNYIHVGVDPYGDLVYKHLDNQEDFQWDGLEQGVAPTYPDSMRDTLLYDMMPYRKQGKFTLCNMTDTDFMNESKHKDSKFAFVFFDGPHTTRAVSTEAVWFANHSAPITRFVFDDWTSYNMALIAKLLEYYDFRVIESGRNKCLMQKGKI